MPNNFYLNEIKFFVCLYIVYVYIILLNTFYV